MLPKTLFYSLQVITYCYLQQATGVYEIWEFAIAQDDSAYRKWFGRELTLLLDHVSSSSYITAEITYLLLHHSVDSLFLFSQELTDI